VCVCVCVCARARGCVCVSVSVYVCHASSALHRVAQHHAVAGAAG
jgi:hypothetical protein